MSQAIVFIVITCPLRASLKAKTDGTERHKPVCQGYTLLLILQTGVTSLNQSLKAY